MARGKKYTVKKGYLDVVCRKWLEEMAINSVKKNGKVVVMDARKSLEKILINILNTQEVSIIFER